MWRSVCLLAAGLMLGSAGSTIAQRHDHGRGQHRTHQGAAEAPSTRDYKAAHHRMMAAMDRPYTGDPDADLRIQMIPHHEGAIDMARVALAHAKDPWTRQLAESIIVEQQREIAEMRAWLAQRGIAAPPDGQPRHLIRADSFRSHHEEPGTLDEARGQSWAPSSGTRAR